ncbi:SMI1/KNR4 family protein [Myceligenerans crystallogenes]|uniref:Knr4/Smi1-like domain-containing protein n=1 Tax=Myceligenerans crystallogenes TaxID=316335 RepID=A0ABN2NJZ7_9MICO
MANWHGVRERVSRLRRRDRSLATFGASGHRFVLAPPLTMEQVREAEAQFGAALPEEYRSFLVEVGAGGAGPGYGMEVLRKERGIWHWGHVDTLLDEIHRSALTAEEVDDAWSEVPEVGPQRADFPDDVSHAAAQEAFRDLDEEAFSRRFRGCIPLGQQGCGWETWLVVSGPQRGHVRTMAHEILPVSDSFYDHYLQWLQRAESGVGIADGGRLVHRSLLRRLLTSRSG